MARSSASVRRERGCGVGVEGLAVWDKALLHWERTEDQGEENGVFAAEELCHCSSLRCTYVVVGVRVSQLRDLEPVTCKGECGMSFRSNAASKVDLVGEVKIPRSA